MKHLTILYAVVVAALSCAVVLLTGCKPSEKNYRAAYEKTMAARTVADEADSTIYSQMRRDFHLKHKVVDGDTIATRSQHIKVTPDGGGIAEMLKTYSVVAAQFKQLFHAQSMRERLFEAGYPQSFIVETAEPYYYVLTGSYPTIEQAAAALKRLSNDNSVQLKAPAPFVLERPARRR